MTDPYEPGADELEKPPARALLDEAYRTLLQDDRLDQLLPDEGKTIVLKPTANDDDDLGEAVLRVRLASDSSTPRNLASERTLLLQIQIDWTSSWHTDAHPTWETDVREAIDDAVGRLGGPSRKPLGSGGDVDADWSPDLERYVGDATYRYRAIDA